GTDTRLYRTLDELRSALPSRLHGGDAVVLKQRWGMGGDGVWKIELDGAELIAQHAAGAAPPEPMTLAELLRRCEPYFAVGGSMAEQPFQPRPAEGMIRVYLTHDEVVGFAHQYPRGLLPPDVTGLPTTKEFLPPSEARYRELRTRTESEWVPQLQQLLGLEKSSLPVIWDADFLYGPKDRAGHDSFVLCEIN